MFIIFRDIFFVLQNLLSALAKGGAIIIYEHGMYEILGTLQHDLGLSILENWKISRKSV